MTKLLTDSSAPESFELSEDLYRDFARAGRLFLFRHGVRESADCEDLVHDALVKALKGWRPNLGSTFAGFFIHVVLRNEMLNWYRARRTHAAAELDETLGSSEDVELRLQRHRTASSLAAYREALSDADRAVLDCAVLLLGDLGTSRTKRGEPHNFASRGAQALGMTRHLFLAAWDRIREGLRRQLREVAGDVLD